MQMDIKVIGPIKEYLKMFNGPDDFNIWYAKNKDDVDKLTTHKLNKMYHIDGYRITKIKGILCLKKDEKKPENDSIEDSTRPREDFVRNDLESIINQIEQLKLDIITIKTTINEIVKAINGE